MNAELTDAELIAERTRAKELARICREQGMVDAANVWNQTANALTAEQAMRMGAPGSHRG